MTKHRAGLAVGRRVSRRGRVAGVAGAAIVVASTTVWAAGAGASATPVGANEFTLVAIPDTQHYVDGDEAESAIFGAQTQWIVDNTDALNIEFTSHLGDIVETQSTILQWQRADQHMDTLDGAGLRVGVAPGNHDMVPSTGSAANYDTYFPPSRYSANAWYGNYLAPTEPHGLPTDPNRLNKDNFQTFSVGGMDFIAIHVEYGWPTYAVAWAGRVLDAYPNHRAILSTHAFLDNSGNRPTSYNVARVSSTSPANVWTQLISTHCNVFLVINGHYHSGNTPTSGEARRTDPNSCGKPVHQVLSDYQSRGPAANGEGRLRYYVFSPDADEIRAYTYNPVTDGYETDDSSQFTLSYDMVGSGATAPGAPAGVTAVAGDASALVSWSPPASDGGSPIIDYRVTPFVSGFALAPVMVGSNATSLNVAPLANGTEHTFRVAAVSSAGTGPDSDPSNAVTPSAPPASPPASTSPPTVSGTAQDGQTLTTSDGTWTGTAPITFGRRWLRCDGSGGNCAEVAGQTAASYAVNAADVGSTLRSRVTATNVAGSSSAESAPTAVVTPAPSAPTFAGSASGAVSSATFVLPRPLGTVAGDVLLAWVATDTTHGISGAPAGWTQVGTTQADGTDSSVSVFRRVVQPGDPASWSGTFAGTETGVVGVVAYRGVDPSSPIDVSAQRASSYGTLHSTSSISPTGPGRLVVALFGGDPGSSPRSGSADVSPAATERLDTQNGSLGYAYAEETLQATAAPISLDVTWNGADTSAAFVVALRSGAAPAPVAPSATSPPTISGTAAEGGALTTGTGAWTGTAPISYAFQWLRCDPLGAACAEIGGETGPSYDVGAADVGSTLRVRVTASNAVGSASAESDATATVTGLQAPLNTSLPTVVGPAVAGSSLSATTGSWSGSEPISYGFEWLRCDGAGGSCAAIGGATAAVYTIGAADVGATLRARVTASNDVGSASAESAQTGVVSEQPDAPTFVSSGSTPLSSSASLTIVAPAGAAAGDLLLAWVATDTTHAIAAVPAGWTQLGTTQADGTDSSVSVFRRVLQPGDPTSWNGSFTSIETGIGGVLAYRGIDTSNPVDAFAQRSATYSTTHSTPTITPTGGDRLVVALFGGDPGSNPRTGSADAAPAATERLDAQSGTLAFAYAEDHLQATAAPIALDVTWNGSESSAAFVVALAPG